MRFLIRLTHPYVVMPVLVLAILSGMVLFVLRDTEARKTELLRDDVGLTCQRQEITLTAPQFQPEECAIKCKTNFPYGPDNERCLRAFCGWENRCPTPSTE